jgi:hypothetical protein
MHACTHATVDVVDEATISGSLCVCPTRLLARRLPLAIILLVCMHVRVFNRLLPGARVLMQYYHNESMIATSLSACVRRKKWQTISTPIASSPAGSDSASTLKCVVIVHSCSGLVYVEALI